MLQKLRQRKLVQWALAYAAAGWVVLQVLQMASGTYAWPALVMRAAFGLIALGFGVTLLLAWFHGERGQQKVSWVELLLVSLLLGVGGALVWRSNSQPPASRPMEKPAPAMAVRAIEKSIAVLPFASMSASQDDGYFADGLSEEVINSLSRVPDLHVSARTSSFALRNSGLTVPAIALRLHVATVLEGSVRRSGGHLRITAQLIRAADGFELWSETYDRSSADSIEIQEDVARSIAHALKTATDPRALAAMQRIGTRSVPAYDAYLKGLALRDRAATIGDGVSRGSAVAAFDQAISLDPAFADARFQTILLARDALSSTSFNTSGVRPPFAERLRDLRERLDAALAHIQDPGMRAYFASIRAMVDLRFVDALRLTQEYLVFRPGDIDAWNQLGSLALYFRDPVLIRRVSEHLFAISDVPDAQAAAMTKMLRLPDLPRAVEMARSALKRFPIREDIAYQAQRVLLTAGHPQEAAAIVPRMLASEMNANSKLLVQLRQACAEGRTADAARIWDQFDMADPDRSIAWHGLNLMGREDAAVAYLAAFDQPAELFQLADFLGYNEFDPGRYPHLRALLQAQGIAIRPRSPEPYACKPTPATG